MRFNKRIRGNNRAEQGMRFGNSKSDCIFFQRNSYCSGLSKNLATVGVGAGQMSRIDSTEIAVKKSMGKHKGSVLASDAFFPFRDNVDLAAEAGITAIIQPGGSVKDKEVIEAADAHKIAMIFTGTRHFKH